MIYSRIFFLSYIVIIVFAIRGFLIFCLSHCFLLNFGEDIGRDFEHACSFLIIVAL